MSEVLQNVTRSFTTPLHNLQREWSVQICCNDWTVEDRQYALYEIWVTGSRIYFKVYINLVDKGPPPPQVKIWLRDTVA